MAVSQKKTIEEVQELTQNFKESPTEVSYIFEELSSKSRDLQTQLNTVRVLDVWIKIAIRILFTIFFMFLLCYQNIKVFGLIDAALLSKQVGQIQLIFGTLVSATLLETYFVARIMVEWCFKDIDYETEKE